MKFWSLYPAEEKKLGDSEWTQMIFKRSNFGNPY